MKGSKDTREVQTRKEVVITDNTLKVELIENRKTGSMKGSKNTRVKYK